MRSVYIYCASLLSVVVAYYPFDSRSLTHTVHSTSFFHCCRCFLLLSSFPRPRSAHILISSSVFVSCMSYTNWTWTFCFYIIQILESAITVLDK
ncbi:uncharacterized protein EV420DRAFT_1559445 [Desarmillaria tabescens]|uniref:Uncharacterized protein n=1 Tax=Armillaria tabescens TaxID=1929756 RepID=A0AA39K0B3_ARMTA|nr:uncharacterized protein EV420DRAFT_1559445 [Desarmillaria tabescens]KAK0452200.1 hypothetical protein EV420DRAFT_1559445 [Desarmillaria tabescens]